MSSKSLFYINNKISDSFTCVTNSDSGTTFDPSVTMFSSKGVRWDFGDSTNSTSLSASKTYSDTGDSKTVTLSFDRPKNISTINMSNDNLVGDIDLSDFTDCTSFVFNTNSQLTNITLPNVDTNIDTLTFFSCDIKDVDLSVIPNFGGSVSFFNNSSLSGLTIPSANTRSFNEFNFGNCDIQGRIDLSGYTGLGGTFNISNNPGITGITLPNVSNNFNSFNINYISISGSLDLTILSGLGGSIQISGIDNITSIDFPESTNTTSLLSINNLSAVTQMNISGMTGLGGTVTIQNLDSITAITFPQSSQNISFFTTSTCALIPEIDLSTLSGASGTISALNNSVMSAITLPYTSGVVTNLNVYDGNISSYVDMKTLTGNTHNDISIRFENNAISTPDVNHMLVDLDNFGWTGGSIDISGGSNGAPDGSSGGYDGTGATQSLISKSWTVTTN